MAEARHSRLSASPRGRPDRTIKTRPPRRRCIPRSQKGARRA